MKRIIALSGLILILCFLPFGAFAVGLGNIHLHSALGQKLNADIALVGVNKESASGLKISLASPEQFDRAGVSRPAILQSLTFKVTPGTSGYRVHVSSKDPIKEPFLTFLVIAKWSNGQMLREYTVLLNPPNYGFSGAAGSVKTPQTSRQTAQTGAGATATATPQTQPSSTQTTTSGTTPYVAPETTSSSAQALGYQPSIPAAGSHYGRIQRGETLWGIANKLTSGNASDIDKMMVAIYRANPQAFRGNINRMKAGASLKIPDEATIRAIDIRDAIAAVKNANQRYEAYRASISPSVETAQNGTGLTGGNTATAESTPETPAAAATAPEAGATETATASTPNAHLQLVAPDVSDTDNQAAPGGNDEAASAAAVTKLQQQLGEAQQNAQSANTKNAKLQGQVDSLKKKLQKSQRLLNVKDKQLSQMQNRVQQPSSSQSKSQSIMDKVTAFVTNKPKALVGILIVLVLIILGIIYARKRRANSAAKSDKPVPPALRTQALDEQEEASDEPEEEAVSEEPEAESEAEPDNSSDPMAEADFNIDYGLYDQAAEVIRNAIVADPGRGELKLKLFQIYFAGGDAAAFSNAAQEFASSWGADNPTEWNEVTTMGQQLVPDEPLFASGGSTSAETGLAASVDSPDIAETELPTEVGTEFGTSTNTDTMSDFTTADDAGDVIDDPRGEALDFDLNEADNGLQDNAPADLAAEPEDKTEADTITGETGDAVEFDLSGLEAELNADAKGESPAEDPLASTQTEFEDAIRELSEFVDTNIPQDAETDKPDPDLVASNMGGATTERDTAQAATPWDHDQEEDVFADDDDDADEMETKLDLAKAYMDMGDNDGARSILEEVVEEGGSDHQNQARSLLTKLG